MRSASTNPESSGNARGLAFPKSRRLLKHAGFQHVYENGRKHFSANMIFFYLLQPAPATAQSPIKLGFTVSRVLGGSVDRNRIRRRLRDVARHALPALENALAARKLSAEVVINPKKAVLAAEIATLRAEVDRGFQVIATATPKPEGQSRK